eukprot:GHVT01090783.1.p2 GENE.GHVT01090783.1~~GHVT01090783.1.p2  ORF type:complete len:143 (+),score=18.29 GHVT01090783.1:1753-2181(+)
MALAKGKSVKSDSKGKVSKSIKRSATKKSKTPLKASKPKSVRVTKKTTRSKIRGSKRAVMAGKVQKTVGGLTKSDLTRNKSGKFVSKRKSAHGKKVFKNIKRWNEAVQKARGVLNIKGFCAVGGKTPQGQKLLKSAREVYKK